MSNYGFGGEFIDISGDKNKYPKYSIRDMAEILKVDLHSLECLCSRSITKPIPVGYKVVRRGAKSRKVMTAQFNRDEFIKWFYSTGAQLKAASKEQK